MAGSLEAPRGLCILLALGLQWTTSQDLDSRMGQREVQALLTPPPWEVKDSLRGTPGAESPGCKTLVWLPVGPE